MAADPQLENHCFRGTVTLNSMFGGYDFNLNVQVISCSASVAPYGPHGRNHIDLTPQLSITCYIISWINICRNNMPWLCMLAEVNKWKLLVLMSKFFSPKGKAQRKCNEAIFCKETKPKTETSILMDRKDALVFSRASKFYFIWEAFGRGESRHQILEWQCFRFKYYSYVWEVWQLRMRYHIQEILLCVTQWGSLAEISIEAVVSKNEKSMRSSKKAYNLTTQVENKERVTEHIWYEKKMGGDQESPIGIKTLSRSPGKEMGSRGILRG